MKNRLFGRPLAAVLAWALLWGGERPVEAVTTPLADQPILTVQVPANVMLAPSVEYPTAITLAYPTAFVGTGPDYLGYFDPNKCYSYVTGDYFQPIGPSAANHVCGTGAGWSGHFLNWATMQGIDMFRWVLTGGNRYKDLPLHFAGASGTPLGVTILQRAYASSQGGESSYFPERSISSTDAGSYTDSGITNKTLYIRNWGLGYQFRVSSSSGATCSSDTSSCKIKYARVEVCRDANGTDGKSLLEKDRCGKYADPAGGTGTVYKPVGLIQKYKDSMNFGAFGYLMTDTSNGGVLRAQLQSVASEITDSGAFYDDPYGFANASLGISASGTINYINKFGGTSFVYKTYDPVSEMYAEVIKYFKNMAPTPSYVSGINSTMRDGFPAFGDPSWSGTASDDGKWKDPLVDKKYSTTKPLWCKKNYVIGIGDVYTWNDSNLSGRTSPTPDTGVDAAMGTLKSAVAWTNAVGDSESISSLGTKTPSYGASGNSYLMAGIAYYAHSEDIRPSVTDKTNHPERTIQTVTTFWMDVLERQMYEDKNQYWLAAKYGGYTKPKGQPPSAFNSATDTWRAQAKTIRTDSSHNVVASGGTSYNLPDNYFPVNTPEKMVAGLKDAFANIAAGSGVAAGVALSSTELSSTGTNALTFQGSYDASSWSGDVKALKVNSIDASTGALTTTPVWSAAAKLNSLVAGTGYSSNRKVVTLAPSVATNATPAVADLVGKPFLFANLSNAQKLALSQTAQVPGGDNVDGQKVLNYLRGDRTYETTASVPNSYRQRASVLGDIVDSRVVYLGSKPNSLYADAFNPGYSTFVSATTRQPLVFAGANDGMLHAFDATDTATGGSELFALVPYAVYAGPDGNAERSGIQALARLEYAHHYYVNATPEIRDVDFARAGGSIAAGAGTYDWRTLLVVGLGKGGRSFVAMDVTNISATMTESQIAAKVLWEFSDPDMGYSYGRPLIAKTARWGWVVILTGGYNNVNGTKPGKGVLFVINPKNGAVLQRIYTGTSDGSAADPLGLVQIEGYTSSYQDYTLEYVYGGDLKGNLWRFDFRSATADVSAPVKLAQFADPDGTPQPITVAPKIEYSAEGLKRYVFVGTGRLLASDDQLNSQQNSFYALRDGTQSRAFGSGTNELPLPGDVSFPVQRSSLSSVSSLLAGATLSDSTPMGWRYDLTGVTDGVTERVVSSIQANDGIVSWIGSMLNADPCQPSGTANLYAVQYGSGQTVLRTYDAAGMSSPQEKVSVATGLAGITLVRLGSTVRIGGTDMSGSTSLYGSSVAQSDDPRVVNWRIIRE